MSVRRPGEPVPDLLDYRVVHRAMTVDLRKLATAAAQLVDRPDPKRMAALRHYLNAVSHEIVSHHQVEDDHVWPFLEAIAGHRTALVSLTEDHERLDPLLHRAGELAARIRSSPELAAVLRELADLLARHVSDEERDVFPIITDFVRVEDYQRMQQQFRRNLRPSLLPFLVPWVLGHAAAEERRAMLAEAGWPLRLLHRLFEPRFRARAELVFGGLSRPDRRVIAIMRAQQGARRGQARHRRTRRPALARRQRPRSSHHRRPANGPAAHRHADGAARRRRLPRRRVPRWGRPRAAVVAEPDREPARRTRGGRRPVPRHGREGRRRRAARVVGAVRRRLRRVESYQARVRREIALVRLRWEG
jgi:iron-sulfur cluster repair protein YtfE (RIC family)